MVRRLLALPGGISPDAADALACAITPAPGGQGLGPGAAALATKGFRVGDRKIHIAPNRGHILQHCRLKWQHDHQLLFVKTPWTEALPMPQDKR